MGQHLMHIESEIVKEVDPVFCSNFFSNKYDSVTCDVISKKLEDTINLLEIYTTNYYLLTSALLNCNDYLLIPQQNLL